MANEIRDRKYIAKDFDSFRSLLLEYARTYYPDKISDFSESSMGGVFLDFAAYVGDSLSYYMDHQVLETDPETAIEINNIEKLIRNSGIKITGATPASALCEFTIKVPVVVNSNGDVIPNDSMLPILKEGSIFTTNNGISFRLVENIDFSDSTNRKQITNVNIFSAVESISLTKTGMCVSGGDKEERFFVGTFEKFKRIILSNPNVTKILSVTDTNGNDYYEVNSLAEEVVYKNVKHNHNATGDVKEYVKIVPAPYRYVTEVDLLTRRTTLIFGGGLGSNFEDDVIPNPSDFALTLYGTSTFSRNLINPSKFINGRTLGVIDENVDLIIKYTYGGGLSHNVGPRAIQNVNLISLEFPNNPPKLNQNRIRSSLSVENTESAVGGENAITPEIYKSLLQDVRTSQMRIVTKEDLLSRIYTMPSNFGRVFKAAISKNTFNNLITNVHIICKNKDSQLANANNYLKDNLANILDSYRMISDVIEIYDAKIINYLVTAQITVDPTKKKNTVIQEVINNIRKLLSINNFNINQPLNISDIRSVIYNTTGVLTVNNLNIDNITGNYKNREYSTYYHDFTLNRENDLIFTPEGGIFELKYREKDIEVIVT